MADLPPLIIPTQIDPTGALAGVAALQSQIGSNPARGGAVGPQLAGTFGGAGIGPPVIGGGGLGAGGTAGNVQSAGAQLAGAIQGVTQQVRAAAAAGGVARTLNGGGALLSAPVAGGIAPVAGPVVGGAGGGAGGGGGYGGGGGTVAAGPVGGGGWTQGNLNQLAAANAGLASGGGGPGGRVNRGGGQSGFLSGGISLYTGVELLRTADRLFTGDRLDRINSGYAGSLTERLEIERSGVERRFQGLFGELAGAELDFTPLGNSVEGPRAARERLSQSIGTSRLRDRNRDLGVDVRSGDRSLAAGSGNIARQRSAIQNRLDAESTRLDSDITQSIIQSSNPALSAEGRAAAQAGLRSQYRRFGQVYGQADIDQRGIDNDVNDQLLEQSGRYGVARGQFNRTYAGRQVLAARAARAAPGSDDARLAGGDLQAYDAEQGYANWRGDYAARGERDESYYRLNRAPNVARATGIFNNGVLDFERARREGTPQQAEFSRQTTRNNLLDFQRSLLESGSAVFSENADLDLGQKGKTGLASTREGDDLAQVLAYMPQLLQALNDLADRI